MKLKSVPGKIILFGEYTILIGSRALAIPLTQRSGSWSFEKNGNALLYKTVLLAYALYLKENSDLISFTVDTNTFLKDLENGLHFESTIPVGYGAGSSGAIVAAVCQKYSDLVVNQLTDLPALKKELGIMENYFHGSSSGIDPLVSLLNKPLLIDKDGRIAPIAIPSIEDTTFFLLDTGISRKTGPLVEVFKEKIKDSKYEQSIDQQLIPSNDLAIDQLVSGDIEKLKSSFRSISQFQFEHFQEMIPEAVADIWKSGLETDLFHLKLCGAGGGGFLLGMTADFEGIRKYSDNLVRLNIG